MKGAAWHLGSLLSKIFTTPTAPTSPGTARGAPAAPRPRPPAADPGVRAAGRAAEAAGPPVSLPRSPGAGRAPSPATHPGPGARETPVRGGVRAALPSLRGAPGSRRAGCSPRDPRRLGPGAPEPGAGLPAGSGPGTLLFALPGIGEERASDSDSEEAGRA